MKTQSKLSRRDFLKLASRLLGVALGGGAYGFYVEPNWVDVNRMCMKLPRLAREFTGLKLAQISDIHLGGWMNAERLRHVVELTIKEQPDLIAITGDFLFGSFDWEMWIKPLLDELREILPALAEAAPTFAVLGNHDYWTNAPLIREMLSDCKIKELKNDVHAIARGEKTLYLCGVDNVWEGQPDLDAVISKMDDPSAAILMAHEPDFADPSAATGRFDLQISGHTHGGQVVVPFMKPIILPYMGRRYPSGIYQVKDMIQYTNRGVGMIAPFARFNCRPEITVFEFEGTL